MGKRNSAAQRHGIPLAGIRRSAEVDVNHHGIIRVHGKSARHRTAKAVGLLVHRQQQVHIARKGFFGGGKHTVRGACGARFVVKRFADQASVGKLLIAGQKAHRSAHAHPLLHGFFRVAGVNQQVGHGGKHLLAVLLCFFGQGNHALDYLFAEHAHGRGGQGAQIQPPDRRHTQKAARRNPADKHSDFVKMRVDENTRRVFSPASAHQNPIADSVRAHLVKSGKQFLCLFSFGALMSGYAEQPRERHDPFF